MADRWWVDDNADGDWNAANNWAAAEGGAGGAGIPTAADRALFSNTSSPNNCTLSANADCLNFFDTVANTGGTNAYTGDFDAATFDIHIHGDAIWINNVGAMDLGSGTWTCDGDFEWEVSSWTYTGSTLVMTTDGKEIRADTGNRKLHNVTLQGSTVWLTLTEVYGAFSVSAGKTSGTGALYIHNGPWAITGATIANPLRIYNAAAANLPVDGTFTGAIDFYLLRPVIVEIVGRIFNGLVRFRVDARNNGSTVFGTAPGQTCTFAEGLRFIRYIGTAANTYTEDFATYNPTVIIAGNLDVDMDGVLPFTLAMGDGTWTVSGDCDLREATVTATASELVLDGAGKSFWGNAQTFYDVTIEESITFEDAFVVSNLFKCITASKTLTFTSGATYAFADIQLDGQAAGTKITLAPSAAAAYNWNVTADPQTDVSFVDVSYCDASTGSQIDASNGTSNDGGNNANWNFGAIRWPWHMPGLGPRFGVGLR